LGGRAASRWLPGAGGAAAGWLLALRLEQKVDDATVEAPLEDPRVSAEQTQLANVVGEHVGAEAADAASVRSGQEPVEQEPAEPFPVKAVLYDERDLRDLRRSRRLVTCDRDQRRLFRVLVLDDEREPRPIVDVGEKMRPIDREARHDGEEALIRRESAQTTVQ